jgi:hypothetical protein
MEGRSMLRSFALSLTRGVLPTLLVVATAAAQTDTTMVAASTPKGPFLGFVIAGAGEFGGDPVATVTYTDGTSQDVNSGQGVSLAVGAELRPSHNSPLALRATVGYKYVTTMAENADITLTRIPLEVIGAYEFDGGFWAGAGVVHHTSVRFKADELTVPFESATGPTVRVGWRWVAASYTALTYQDEQENEYDASSFGLVFSHTFGRRR